VCGAVRVWVGVGGTFSVFGLVSVGELCANTLGVGPDAGRQGAGEGVCGNGDYIHNVGAQVE